MVRIKENIDAISEIIGVVLLFGLTIALFSVLYVSMNPSLSESSMISTNIVAYIENEHIILEHHGGESLTSDSSVTFAVGDTIVTAEVTGSYLSDLNNNNKWDIGEKIQFTENLDGLQVTTSVINQPSNTLLFNAILQKGSSDTHQPGEISTFINAIIPYQIHENPLEIVATSINKEPDNISIYYQWSSTNWSEGEEIIFETGFENAGELAYWLEDPIRTTADSGYLLERENEGQIGPKSGSYYLGGTGDFNPKYAAYNRSIDLTGYTNVSISVWYSFEDTETDDELGFYYWDGSDWIALFEDTEPDSDNDQIPWAQVTTDIDDSIDELILQFRWSTSSSTEHMMIDDLLVTGEQNASSNWVLWNSPSNPDTASPWTWEFDFPQDIGYYQFYSIGKSSFHSDESIPSSPDARCYYGAVSSSPTPIAQWLFDENMGSVAYDSIEDNDGSIQGATWDTGVNGAGLSFDGSSDYVQVSYDEVFDVSHSLSLEAWVKPLGSSNAFGDIDNRIVHSKYFGTDGSEWAKSLHISDEVYAVVYEDWGNNGRLKTYEISSEGIISDFYIDSLTFDDSYGVEPDMVHVTGDIYAIVYRGSGSDGYVTTVEIESDGTIANDIIDIMEFDNQQCYYPEIIKISDSVYAVAYQGKHDDGYITTFEINAGGDISHNPIDSMEFDNSNGRETDIIHVTNDMYAVVYRGDGDDGFAATIEITQSGDITNNPIDVFEFETDECYFPDIIHVSGEVYAIAYAFDWWDGYVATIEIDNTGDITNSVVDRYRFEEGYAVYCSIISISDEIYAISYLGPGVDGYVKTLSISTDGTIQKSIVDVFEFDGATGYYPYINKVRGNLYSICYTDASWRGKMITFPILSKGGIYKDHSFGMYLYESELEASINDRLISCVLAAGWNHIVLTYNSSESPPQMMLYRNGSLQDSMTLTDSITVNTNDFFIGRYFNGMVDEVSLYDVSLSSDEILSQYSLYNP